MGTMALRLLMATALLAVPLVGASAQEGDETDGGGPAILTGSMDYVDYDQTGLRFDDDIVSYSHVETADLAMDDPRLAGRWRAAFTNHEYRGGGNTIVAALVEIKNDLGSWSGTGMGYTPGYGTDEFVYELVGHGAYDGQTAILFMRENPPGSNIEYSVTGIVVPRALPEAPIDFQLPTS